MAYGPVFTSSAGGTIGGPLPFTRLRGQVLAGQSNEPPANNWQSGTAPGGATGYNGSAAAPLYSFYNRPDLGLYPSVVTSGAGDVRMSVGGSDVWAWTSAAVSLMGNQNITNKTTNAVDVLIPAPAQFIGGSSAGFTGGFIYISQSSYGLTSSNTANYGSTPTPAITGMAALVFDSARKKISVYSTVIGDWVSTPVMTCS